MSCEFRVYERGGDVVVVTDAIEERDLVDAVARVVRGEESLERLRAVVTHAVDLVCKIRGYKAPTVTEKRVLTSGSGIVDDDALVVSVQGDEVTVVTHVDGL